MKPNREHIITEILRELEKGASFSACADLCDLNWSIPTTTFKRYWKEASERHKLAQEKLQTEIMELSAEIKKDRVRKAILTREERLEILSEIARGEQPMTKYIVVSLGDNQGSVIKERTIYPAWKDKRDAVAEINKMEGDYAPIKKDITSKGESLAPAPVFQIILDESDDDE